MLAVNATPTWGSLSVATRPLKEGELIERAYESGGGQQVARDADPQALTIAPVGIAGDSGIEPIRAWEERVVVTSGVDHDPDELVHCTLVRSQASV